MENGRHLCLLPSNAPVLTDGAQDQCRVSYGSSVGERISSPQRTSHITEIEREDLYERSICHHPSRNHAAQAAIKLQQHKKGRQRTGKKHKDILRALTQDELESDRYLQYRDKNRQKTDNKVWPDELEAAFQRGMRHITTSENTPTVAAPSRGPYDKLDNCRSGNQGFQAYTSSPFLYSTQGIYSHSLPPPTGMLGSHCPSVHRIEFDMFIVDAKGSRFHSYTSNQSDIGAPLKALDEVREWRELYPCLASYEQQGLLDSEVVLIEANLNLLEELPPTRSALSIHLFADIAQSGGRGNWRSKTTFYESKGNPVDVKKFYEAKGVQKTYPWENLECCYIPHTDDARLEIPLQSRWWVDLFCNITMRKKQAMPDRPWQALEEEWSSQYLQEMSVMQEIWTGSDDTDMPACRVAILLWKFSRTRHGETGIATWRKVRLSPQTGVNPGNPSPPPPSEQRIALDTTYQDLAIPSTSLCEEHSIHGEDIFVEDSEKIINSHQSTHDPPSPALTSDYTSSFPSSTSTSFPPSVTNDILSQGNSQEATFQHRSSFIPHDPIIVAQETDELHGDLELQYQHPKHTSQNSNYDLQDSQYFAQESFNSLTVGHTQPHEEDLYSCHETTEAPRESSEYRFASGQIRLAFASSRCLSTSQSPLYPAPAVAMMQIDSHSRLPQLGHDDSPSEPHLGHQHHHHYHQHAHQQQQQSEELDHGAFEMEHWDMESLVPAPWETGGEYVRRREDEAEEGMGEMIAKTGEIELDPSGWMGGHAELLGQELSMNEMANGFRHGHGHGHVLGEVGTEEAGEEFGYEGPVEEHDDDGREEEEGMGSTSSLRGRDG
ncbi:MAG: hypothetical protein Q9214_003384 [Letrouitia sp. 1 TL-2023]